MASAEQGPRPPAIRTPDQRLRVFVSSTLEELAAERDAARAAIEQLRLAPVMFESGARAHPPQALYRAYLEQSDVFVGIYWQRYGWVGPDMTVSGLEDELRLATGMPRLLYVKVPAPGIEPGLRRMLDGIRAEGASAYKKFTDAAELRELVAGDLATMLAERFGRPDRDDRWPAIPSPVTATVGRDTDVAEVTRMLTASEGRLVVLTGAGGAGKTRLALAVAERTRKQWVDGVAFVDLSSVSSPALVPDAVASAGFTLTSQNAAAVTELCRRLDGLPLALELAAASMRLLTPEQILARLPEQLERPGAIADLPGRQQTLTRTIQWSEDLLPAPAQRMLARLSVFAAPFTAEAAEAVCGEGDSNALHDLSTLLDHSMVIPAERPDGERAFRLLDPIRRFAAAQLTDASETLDRLEGYLLGVLDTASPRYGADDQGTRRLDSEQPNLRTVLSWIAGNRRPPDRLLRALGNVWVWLLVRGHMRQSSTLWQQIAPLLDPAQRTGADWMAHAWLLIGGWTIQGEFTRVIDLVDEVLPDFRRDEKPSRTALLMMARGIVRVYTAHDLARADFAEAQAVARAAGDPLILGYIQAHYGALLCLDGDLDQARALHEEMLTIARSSGDQNLLAEAHYLLATDYLAAHDTGSATPELAAAVQGYQKFDHVEGLARCLGALSALALDRDDPRLAARLIGTVSAVRDRLGLMPWPYVTEAVRRTIKRAAALLPGSEYTAEVAAGRSQSLDEALTAALPILEDRQQAGTR